MTDTERLDYMIQREAYVGWTKDGERCRVFKREEEDGAVPVCGWPNFFDDGRQAIDAAMRLNTVKTIPPEEK